MAKKFVSKGGCRGVGKFYQLFWAETDQAYTIKSFSPQGNELPVALLNIGPHEYVASFVDFAVNQTFAISDESGQVVFKGSNRPLANMLESKINGVLSKELCSRIRSVDHVGLNSLPVIALDGFTPSPDGAVIRGSISNELLPACAKIVAFDAKGKQIGESTGFVQARTSAVPFSVKASDFKNFLALAAVDAEGNQFGVFTSCKKDVLRKYRKACERHYRNATNEPFYYTWLSENLVDAAAVAAQRDADDSTGPLFSVIVPLYKTPLNFFREMADSVLAQTYSRWELVLVNSTPEIAELRELVSEYVLKDERIKVVELEANLGITENTAAGIKVASGDFCCFFDHDDVLEPDILFEYAKAVVADPTIDLLYCDEDKMYPDGSLANPTFKPDFSLDMVRDNNYVCHLLTVKRSAMQQIEPSGKELDGAQDHAMVLKIAELGGTIHHVPKMLYHWRISKTSTAGNADSKPYANEAGIRAVQQHLDRCGLAAKVECAHGRSFRYAPHYQVSDATSCSVVMATDGASFFFGTCISAICSGDRCPNELIVVCPSSCEQRIRDVVDGFPLKTLVNVQDGEFNKYAWRNRGAELATGDVLVFLDDDVAPVDAGWLNNLVGFAVREDIGVVGTMSCDSGGIVLQAGLSHVGESLVRLSHGLYREDPGYIYLPLTVRDVFAVDGACQAFSRRSFDVLGGYDESYSSLYADVDMCLRASAKGSKVVYTPESAIACHGVAGEPEAMGAYSATCIRDKSRLLSKWADEFAKNDRWFSPYFSRDPKSAELYKLDGFDQWMA